MGEQTGESVQWEEFTFNSVQLHHHGSYSKQAIQIHMAFNLHPAGYDATSDEYGVRQRERDLDLGVMRGRTHGLWMRL